MNLSMLFSIFANIILIYCVLTPENNWIVVLYFIAQLLVSYFEYQGVNWHDFHSIRNHIMGGFMK